MMKDPLRFSSALSASHSTCISSTPKLLLTAGSVLYPSRLMIKSRPSGPYSLVGLCLVAIQHAIDVNN